MDFSEKIIDNENPVVVFKAGAGSGKTYQLIKAIRYCLKTRNKCFQNTGRKILVITYTNAGVNEIKDRIGTTDCVEISTIHDRLWDIISLFKEDLLRVHVKNLKDKIQEANEENKTSTVKWVFDKRTIDDEFIELYQKHKKDRKDDFFRALKLDAGITLKDAKAFISNAIKIIRYNETLRHIENKDEDYLYVRYEPMINYDILHDNKFSHDTLIKYSKEVFETNKLCVKYFIDKYPFVMVDEYQDTNEDVISILDKISKESKGKTKIMLFGDDMQSIYSENTIKDKLNTYGSFNVDPIYSPNNYRSLEPIVALSNRVRGDSSYEQVAVRNNSDDCHLKSFYSLHDTNEDNEILKFIEIVKKVLNINDNNPLDVFLLKNSMIVEREGFANLYATFLNTKYYKDHYEQRGSELLNDDTKKLGSFPKTLYELISFYINACDESMILSDIFSSNVINQDGINGKTLKQITSTIKNWNISTLKDLLNNIDAYCKRDKVFNNVFNKQFSDQGIISEECLWQMINDKLFVGEEDITKVEDSLNQFLCLSIEECKRWVNFINGKSNSCIRYHTFHSTKGREYDNVAVVFTNSFASKKDYVRSIFANLDETSDAKRLLYVAVSRARNNLYTLMIDSSFDRYKNNYNKIFLDTKNLN